MSEETDPFVYYSDVGMLWVERYAAPWPYIQRAAMRMASNSNEYHVRWGVQYEGINPRVKVTKDKEMPCIEECTCCRYIEAHQFMMVEMDR